MENHSIHFLIQVCLVVIQTFAYIKETKALIVARSAGILLDFNMSFIMLLVLKRCITCVGNIKCFRICLPINDFAKIHKLTGIYILFLSFTHTISHCLNVCKFNIEQNIINWINFNLRFELRKKT